VGVLAVPNADASIEFVCQYVETLLEYQSITKNSLVSSFITKNTSNILEETQSYPNWDNLAELFRNKKIIPFDTKSVIITINSLMNKINNFEKHYNIIDILINNVETQPEIFKYDPGNSFQYDLARSTTLIAIIRKFSSSNIYDHLFFFRKELSKESAKIRLNALIDILEHERVELSNWPLSPTKFEGEVLTCHSLGSFFDCLNESDILANSSDKEGIEFAIRIALFKREREQAKNFHWNDLIVPTIGKVFPEYCHNICRESKSIPKTILDTIVDTVKSINMNQVHPFRIDSAGNAPQKKRGKDTCWRRNVNYDIRLHYYKCEDGTIELASINQHNDFSFPE
jgi:hypothetical protein